MALGFRVWGLVLAGWGSRQALGFNLLQLIFAPRPLDLKPRTLNPTLFLGCAAVVKGHIDLADQCQDPSAQITSRVSGSSTVI